VSETADPAMVSSPIGWPTAARLDEHNFQRLADFVEAYCGIKMPRSKLSMMEGRLRKRLRDLGLDNYSDYCQHVFREGGIDEEGVYLIDAMTTNKTDFFREPKHFAHLTEVALPTLLASAGRTAGERPLRLWSAASSIGAEAYTMAMVLDTYAAIRGRPLVFDIIGTDICTEVLDQACQAVYPLTMIDMVPLNLRKRYFLRSVGDAQETIRVRPEIRKLVRFGRLNLMEDNYPFDRDMDVIFCRNILIYFDRPTQQAVLEKMCHCLRPGGYLYIGHGESATGMTLPMTMVAPSVFTRD